MLFIDSRSAEVLVFISHCMRNWAKIRKLKYYNYLQHPYFNRLKQLLSQITALVE